MQAAKKTVRKLWKEMRDVPDEAAQRSFLRFVRASESAHKLSAMIKLAEDELPIAPEKFDQDPWLLNCANGIVDLRTGSLGPHRRDAYRLNGQTTAVARGEIESTAEDRGQVSGQCL